MRKTCLSESQPLRLKVWRSHYSTGATAFMVSVYYMPVSFVEAPCAPAPEEVYDQADESPAAQYAPSVVPSAAPSMTPSADSACSSSNASDETAVALANVCQGVGE